MKYLSILDSLSLVESGRFIIYPQHLWEIFSHTYVSFSDTEWSLREWQVGLEGNSFVNTGNRKRALQGSFSLRGLFTFPAFSSFDDRDSISLLFRKSNFSYTSRMSTFDFPIRISTVWAPCSSRRSKEVYIPPFHSMKRHILELPYWKHRSICIAIQETQASREAQALRSIQKNPH